MREYLCMKFLYFGTFSERLACRMVHLLVMYKIIVFVHPFLHKIIEADILQNDFNHEIRCLINLYSKCDYFSAFSAESLDFLVPGHQNNCLVPVPDVQQDCTIFSGVSYLGAAAINAPKSEAEIQRNMCILNEQSSEQAIKVSVSVPSLSNGTVV